ncbi:MAG: hypothetical protein GQ565_03095 [Candidatus Aegiribacteria sp.]|nr:hypothetical protein [Candidatus Aegiribacteria sp.]
MTTIEKIEWCNKYTHRAANRQGQLVALYISGEVGHLGYDIDLPPATIDAMKVEVNALADRAVMAQSHIASVTD